MRQEVKMRDEREMYELIMGTAESDERIRAVYMNGSRTNENAVRDIFQDYDIVYVVTDTRPFIEDRKWIERFGQIMFMQYPDENPYDPSDPENSYAWLMQFTDGNRIDLTVQSIPYAKSAILKDKLCKILLDKDHILPEMPKATDIDRHVKKPSRKQYLATCNEFWWCLGNVAKGLWRKEIPYAQDMLNFNVRKQLEMVLSWRIGIKTDFQVSVGKSGKYMYRWLSEEEWSAYLGTYCAGNADAMWTAIETMCELFENTAKRVGIQLGYEYNEAEGKACRDFLEHVKALPENAEKIY